MNLKTIKIFATSVINVFYFISNHILETGFPLN